MPRKEVERFAVAEIDSAFGGRRENAVAVLLISPFEEDRACLENTLNPLGWKVCGARNLREALACLRENPVPVAICEAELMVGSWRDALRALQMFANPPSFIVASRLADHALWIEVLKAGGYDVLAKPFQVNEVGRIARLARLEWQYRQAQASRIPVPARAVAASA